MAIPPKLDLLLDAMDDSNTAIVDAINSERPSAAYAYEADLLGGTDINTAIEGMFDISEVHIDRTDNPHNITPALISAYPKDDFDTKQGLYLPAELSVISRYGLPSFIQPPISGSFKGNVAANKNGIQMIVERDGTLVALRSGTDGLTNGVFYSYLPNALGPTVGVMQHTTRRYRPGGLTAGFEIESICATGDGCFVGVLENTAGVNQNKLILILTNGTADERSHTCYLLPNTLVGNANWSAALGYRWELAREGDTIALTYANYNTTPSLTIDTLQVFKTSINGISPNIVTPLTVTNIGNVSYPRPYFSDTWTSTDGSIQLYATIQSTLLADKPLFLVTPASDAVSVATVGENGWPPIITKIKNGQLRIYAQIPYKLSGVTAFTIQNRNNTNIVITVTLATGATTITTGSGIPVNVDFVNSLFTVSGGNATGGWSWIFPSTVLNNNLQCIIQRGFFFTYRTTTAGDNLRGVWRTPVPGGLDDWDGLNIVNYASAPLAGTVGNSCPAPFASPITFNTKLVGCVPGGLLYSTYDATGGRKPVLVKNLNSALVDYTDADGVVSKGLTNTNDRTLIPDVLSTLMATFVSGTLPEVAYASRFVTSLATTRKAFLDANAAYTGADVTLTTTMQDTIIAAVATAAGAGAGYTEAYLDFTIPQVTVPGIPCVGVLLQANNATGNVRYITFVCAVNATTGVVASISGLTIVSIRTSVSTVIDPAYTFYAPNGYANSGFVAPVFYVDGSTSIRVMLTTVLGVNVAGAARTYTCSFTIAKTGGAISSASDAISALLGNSYGGTYPVAVPGLGVGSCLPMLYDTACGFKFASAIEGAPANGLVVNQNVLLTLTAPKEGWDVFFTTEVPIILGGVKGVVPPTTINLLSIDPAPNLGGDEFFVYVVNTAGVFSYAIYNTKTTQPSSTVMYIGSIVTGANGVIDIKIGNVTRIGNYNISTVAAHNSIPVSLGLPMNPAMLEWT